MRARVLYALPTLAVLAILVVGLHLVHQGWQSVPDDPEAERDVQDVSPALALGLPEYAEPARTPRINEEPAEVVVLRKRIRGALEQHQFQQAVTLVAELHRHLPDDLQGNLLLCDAYVELGELRRATEALQKVLDLKPTGAAYFRAAWLLHLRGEDARARQTLDLALDAFNSRDKRSRAWAYTEQGDLLRYEGRLDEAEARYEKALQLKPRFQQAQTGLARLALARGELEGAERMLLRLRATPGVLSDLAIVQLALGREQAASETIRRAQRFADGGHWERAVSICLSDHDVDPEEAVRLAREEMAERPNLHTRDALAWALSAQGHHAQALAILESVLKSGVREPRILFHAGVTAAKAGRPERARGWLREAYRRDPGLKHHPRAIRYETL